MMVYVVCVIYHVAITFIYLVTKKGNVSESYCVIASILLAGLTEILKEVVRLLLLPAVGSEHRLITHMLPYFLSFPPTHPSRTQ